MRLLISGSHGFIGRACSEYFENLGYEVVHLVRDKRSTGNSIFWDPEKGEAKKEDFEDFDAIFHLAGKNLSEGRWTKKRKQLIFLSRCRDTWLLSEILRRLYRPPKTLITASAVGYYGNRGEESLTEASCQGQGFLADLCGKWESATKGIEGRGVRVVPIRLGAVLSKKGGLLKKMLPLYKWGLGPVFGSGKQYVSWIALTDLLSIFQYVLLQEKIEGPVNAVAPFVVPQEAFARLLAGRLKRKVRIKIPQPFLRLFAGAMADELLLASQKAYPTKLLQSGYAFSYPDLESYFLSETL